MFAPPQNSSWDLPGRATNLTSLCHQKSAFLASQSASDAYDTRLSCALFIAFITFLHEVSLGSVSTNEEFAKSGRGRIGIYIFSSVCTSLVAFLAALYVLANFHQFYCEVEPDWHNWDREWVTTALVPLVLAACDALHWVVAVVNLLLFKTVGKKYCFWPFALTIYGLLSAAAIAVSVSVLAAAFAVLIGVFCLPLGIYKLVAWAGTRCCGRRGTRGGDVEVNDQPPVATQQAEDPLDGQRSSSDDPAGDQTAAEPASWPGTDARFDHPGEQGMRIGYEWRDQTQHAPTEPVVPAASAATESRLPLYKQTENLPPAYEE